MTKEEILKLGPGSDTDKTVAERVMGICAHREVEKWSIEDGNDYDWGFECKKCGADPHSKSSKCPAFSTDLNACHEMEAELLKQGLAADYARKFAWVTSDTGDFHLIHTDALTKCKAALLAVAGVN